MGDSGVDNDLTYKSEIVHAFFTVRLFQMQKKIVNATDNALIGSKLPFTLRRYRSL